MKSFRLRNYLVSSIIVFLASASFATDGVGGKEWKARMRIMLSDVVTLLPLAFNDSQFRDPKNADAIRRSLASLASHSIDLKKHTTEMKPSDGAKIDPSFLFMADAFAGELDFARETFDQGDDAKVHSQTYIRSAISKCMLCHTQSDMGPELKLDSFKTQLASLAPTDRILAFAATRQFDEALKEFDGYASASKVKQPDNSVFDRSAHAALAIEVRVKRSPKLTLALIDEITESAAGSQMLKADLKGWRNAVIAWQSEKVGLKLSDQSLFAQANSLAVDAWAKRRSLEKNENSDVQFLRASSNLHELLSIYPKTQLRPKAYLLLASIYQALPAYAMWDLGDEYLGACIKEFPHSAMGEKCFREYDDSMISGYTGSSGTHLPSAIQQQLARLKELAKRSPSDSR